jgi:polar amino acid transport system permease protein
MLDIIRDYWTYFLLGPFPDGPIGGVALTLLLSIVSLAITFPLALLVALARKSRRRFLVRAATIYVYALRGLPLLFLLLWIYFLLPYVIGRTIPTFWTVVIAIVLYQGAYLSEVIRGGIEGLPKGQTEAARALGLSEALIMRKIILPQALYNVIPGIVNQLTVIVKESSLGYVIGLGEVTFVSGQINTYLLTQAIQVYAILACIYFIICFSLSRLVAELERRIRRRRASVNDAPAQLNLNEIAGAA